MSEAIANADWLSAILALGTYENETWSAIGCGVLYVDHPVVWLITTRRVVAHAGQSAVAAWIGQENGTTLVNLTDLHETADLSWVEHESLDLAVTVFPISASWTIKAFDAGRCAAADRLWPSLPALTVCFPYGAGGPEVSVPEPLVLDGVISRVDLKTTHIQSTARTLPLNVGAPLLVRLPSSPNAILLAGILIEPIMLPASPLPPFPLSNAIPASAAVELIRSEAANAQRARALELSQA